MNEESTWTERDNADADNERRRDNKENEQLREQLSHKPKMRERKLWPEREFEDIEKANVQNELPRRKQRWETSKGSEKKLDNAIGI